MAPPQKPSDYNSVQNRARIAAARKAKRYSVTDGRGASVMAKKMAHGGYIGAVGGGYKNAKPSTPAENAAWVKGAKKRGLLPGGKKRSARKPTAATRAAAISARRDRVVSRGGSY